MNQQHKILTFLHKNPTTYYKAKDFSWGNAIFIGYEAPTRLGDLQRKELVKSRWSNEKTKEGRLLKEYAITVLGMEYMNN